MKMRVTTIANVRVTHPDIWSDISADVEGGTPTLAPSVGPDLESMLREFGETRKGAEPANVLAWSTRKLIGVSGDFREDDELLRVWYVSDTSNVVFVTYVTFEVSLDELSAADAIVRSIEFPR
jgi:hypothetical protein